MAYDTGKPFSYGIPDGNYVGRATTASCYEKDGRLILDVRFAVKNPQTGEWYKVERNGKTYEWEANKRHWLTNAEGSFNEATINGIREWAKGWNPATFDDFYWFQQPDANGVPFGNLAAVGEVELSFQIDKTGAQQLWIHDPNRPRAGRKAYVPDGAVADAAQIKAKWGSKAKALFASMPRTVTVTAAPAAATAAQAAPAPVRPAAVPAASRGRTPARPAPAPAAQKPAWDGYPRNTDGAFAYFCSLLGEPYQSAKHDEKWFAIYDGAAQGKDPDQFAPADVERLFAAVKAAM